MIEDIRQARSVGAVRDALHAHAPDNSVSVDTGSTTVSPETGQQMFTLHLGPAAEAMAGDYLNAVVIPQGALILLQGSQLAWP